MKLGWLWCSVMTIGTVALFAACSDDDGANGALNTTPINTPDGGGVDGASSSGDGATGVDSSKPPSDASPDAPLAPPACNDGKLDLGETCDPLSSCPTSCPPDKCQLRSLDNGGTCSASCSNVALQTQCINGDGCCPPACNTLNDSDCVATCGNGVKEATETCDPASDCPTSCPANGCQARKLTKAGTCEAKCVNDNAAPIACSSVADSCCPVGGCLTVLDPDCSVGGCGNGTKDPTELCDTGIMPPAAGSCPTACPLPTTDAGTPNMCKVRELVGSGCQTACVDKPDIVLCANGDGCCPSTCNANNDSDCLPVCNNGVREPGEECDGNCPKSCAPEGCQLKKLDKPGTCQAKCIPDTIQTQCKASDACCPPSCTAATDNDCVTTTTCPNGRIEANETCDDGVGSPTPCPTCMPAQPLYSCFQHRGKPATCDVECNAPILLCDRTTDGCCPYVGATGSDCHGGTTRTDADCQGDGWNFTSFATSVVLKAGECATVTVSNINIQGSYDLTTCVPPGAIAAAPLGNPTLSNATQAAGTGPGTVVYAVANDDCTDKAAVPRLAGWSCDNKVGLTRMACASPSPGGFIVNYNTPIQIELCTVDGTGGTFPISVLYNAVKKPTIDVLIH